MVPVAKKSRRYGDDKGEGKEEMEWSSVGIIYRGWIVREWDDNYVRKIDLHNEQRGTAAP